jgi:hypothetical protein
MEEDSEWANYIDLAAGRMERFPGPAACLSEPFSALSRLGFTGESRAPLPLAGLFRARLAGPLKVLTWPNWLEGNPTSVHSGLEVGSSAMGTPEQPNP